MNANRNCHSNGLNGFYCILHVLQFCKMNFTANRSIWNEWTGKSAILIDMLLLARLLGDTSICTKKEKEGERGRVLICCMGGINTNIEQSRFAFKMIIIIVLMLVTWFIAINSPENIDFCCQSQVAALSVERILRNSNQIGVLKPKSPVWFRWLLIDMEIAKQIFEDRVEYYFRTESNHYSKCLFLFHRV